MWTSWTILLIVIDSVQTCKCQKQNWTLFLFSTGRFTAAGTQLILATAPDVNLLTGFTPSQASCVNWGFRWAAAVLHPEPIVNAKQRASG